MIYNNNLTFDAETKRWYLTEEYVYNEMGIDLEIFMIDDLDTNVSTLKARKIKYACDMLYDYIDAVAINKESAYYLFAVNKDFNNALLKALDAQLHYFIVVGDVTNDIDGNLKKSVSERAIARLDAVGVFDTVVYSIPKEW
jgi:hypothetical protein